MLSVLRSGVLMILSSAVFHDLVDRVSDAVDKKHQDWFRLFCLNLFSEELTACEVAESAVRETHLKKIWEYYRCQGGKDGVSFLEEETAESTCLMMVFSHNRVPHAVIMSLLAKEAHSHHCFYTRFCVERKKGVLTALSAGSHCQKPSLSEDCYCLFFHDKLSASEKRGLEKKIDAFVALFASSEGVLATQALAQEAAAGDHFLSWVHHFYACAHNMFQDPVSQEALTSFLTSLPADYRVRHTPEEALEDFLHLKETRAPKELRVRLFVKNDVLFMKMYCADDPIPLDTLVRVLGHMGLCVLSESSFSFAHAAHRASLHHMTLKKLPFPDYRVLETLLEQALRAVFAYGEESDDFQKMIPAAGLSWEECRLLRAYVRYLKQLGVPYGRGYVESTLLKHPDLVTQLLALFHARLAPSPSQKSSVAVDPETLLHDISGINRYDEERLFRSLYYLVMATVRANVYQRDHGEPKRYVALKFDCRVIEDMPSPRPMFEIFVYAPFMEGVHLRSGRVSRGGLRWSDRQEDYRDEVLDLLKTQVIKNAAIVPVGAKGGFVTKKTDGGLLGDRLSQSHMPDAYGVYVRGLLDLTDNLQKKKVVRPQDMQCLDDADPYLVVAADKGTATKSDEANALSAEYHFWLGDAFASGGAQGYDHKKIGITARGAWKSTEHHFRTLVMDLSQPFSVVGIGDMSGDVFGNGMLLSQSIQLMAAFDHRDIFLDPHPDPLVSFKERKRLFQKKHSSWKDYHPELISKGGGVFSRSLRMIPLSAAVRAWLKVSQDKMTPDELIRALLKSPVDLLWFGGIGTFVKGEKEPDITIADSGNNHVRVNASDVRARVVVEGANLGFTPQGRVEYALAGGSINADALDNAAGVMCSDYEVNIKILCAQLMERGKLSEEARNTLLKDMTAEVVDLVLRRLYWQNQGVYFVYVRGIELLEEHERLLQRLEKVGALDRERDALPAPDELQRRRSSQKGLTRPEIVTLMALSKIDLHKDILDSALPEDPFLMTILVDYFPPTLSQRFSSFYGQHPLKKEIIATVLSNLICDTLGPSFVHEVFELTRVTPAHIAKAILVVRHLLAASQFDALEVQDMNAEARLSLLWQMDTTIKRLVVWFLRHEKMDVPIKELIGRYEKGFCTFRQDVHAWLPHEYQTTLNETWGQEAAPDFWKQHILPLDPLMFATDIIQVQRFVRKPLAFVSQVYYELGDLCGVRWLRDKVAHFPVHTYWQKKGLQEIIEQAFSVHQQLVLYVLSNVKGDHPHDVVTAWRAQAGGVFEDYLTLLEDVRSASFVDVSPLIVLGQELRRFYEHMAGTCVMTVSFR